MFYAVHEGWVGLQYETLCAQVEGYRHSLTVLKKQKKPQTDFMSET